MNQAIKETTFDIIPCVRMMLRPIARYCLRRSVKIQEIMESLKVILIEVAAEQMEKESREVTLSRLSVMTGIHRRDVARIHKRHEQRNEQFSIIAKITGHWEGNRRFRATDGTPNILSLGGVESEFHKLVLEVTQDIKPHTILFELQRLGMVEVTPEGVKLKSAVYKSVDESEAARMIATHSAYLSSTIEENMRRTEVPLDPNFHIVTRYDNIIEGAAEEIRKWVLIEGTKFHERVRNYLSLYDKDVNAELIGQAGGVEVVVGGFSFTNA